MLVSSDTSVPLGSLTHWMYPGPFGPGAFHGHTLRRSRARLLRSGDGCDELKGGSVRRWKRCELRVLACERASQSQVDTWRELFEAELLNVVDIRNKVMHFTKKASPAMCGHLKDFRDRLRTSLLRASR